jgi:hypothetical protein
LLHEPDCTELPSPAGSEFKAIRTNLVLFPYLDEGSNELLSNLWCVVDRDNVNQQRWSPHSGTLMLF